MVSHEVVADRYASPIHVQVFSGAAKSIMSRGAALHLYRLLQQYSWCLAVDDYAVRWAGFWPRLKPVERVILVHTIKAHCDGEFGRRLIVVKFPVDFEFFEDDTRHTQLTVEVEQEFERLLEEHCSVVAGNEIVREWISVSCPTEYEVFERAKALGRVFGTGAWVCPERVGLRSVEVLRECGADHWTAARSAAAVEKAMFGFYEGCSAAR
jgi:hypothetical protein